MLPLCTKVTCCLFLGNSKACLMARLTRRWEPVLLMGLMPIPESRGIRFFPCSGVAGISSSLRILIKRFRQFRYLVATQCLNKYLPIFSINNYIQLFGIFVGRGRTCIVTARTHAGIQVKNCRSATFKERIPPPTGIIKGPLIATPYSSIAVRVS